jgi:hypothetical protein
MVKDEIVPRLAKWATRLAHEVTAPREALETTFA